MLPMHSKNQAPFNATTQNASCHSKTAMQLPGYELIAFFVFAFGCLGRLVTPITRSCHQP